MYYRFAEKSGLIFIWLPVPLSALVTLLLSSLGYRELRNVLDCLRICCLFVQQISLSLC